MLPAQESSIGSNRLLLQDILPLARYIAVPQVNPRFFRSLLTKVVQGLHAKIVLAQIFITEYFNHTLNDFNSQFAEMCISVCCVFLSVWY